VKSGRMIGIPYQQGLNDIRVIFQGGHTPKDWYQMVCDQFDTLYAEGATQSRVITIPLHPFVIGLAFRVKYLDMALQYICSHHGVWKQPALKSPTTFMHTITKTRSPGRLLKKAFYA
jgi:hypothetical protein